jgi:hypothetical protein
MATTTHGLQFLMTDWCRGFWSCGLIKEFTERGRVGEGKDLLGCHLKGMKMVGS